MIYGVGNSAVSALEICDQLKGNDVNDLKIDMMLLDPQPNNNSISVAVAGLANAKITWTSKLAILKDCKIIRNVQFLFSSENDISDCSAKLPQSMLPVMPNNPRIKIAVDVVPGYTGEIQILLVKNGQISASPKALITFHQVIHFMGKKAGVKFNPGKLSLDAGLNPNSINLLKEAMNEELKLITSDSEKTMCLGNAILQVRNGKYLNRYHCTLLSIDNAETSIIALSVQEAHPTEDQVNKFWKDSVKDGAAYQIVDKILSENVETINKYLPVKVPENTDDRLEYIINKTGQSVAAINNTKSTIETSMKVINYGLGDNNIKQVGNKLTEYLTVAKNVYNSSENIQSLCESGAKKVNDAITKFTENSSNNSVDSDSHSFK